MRPVLENYLDEYIESVCGQIRLSVQMDDIRWAHSEGYTRRSPERDWQEAVACLKDYMRRRMEFLMMYGFPGNNITGFSFGTVIRPWR